MAIEIERDKKRKIHNPATGGNINRKNKVELSFDSCGLSRSGNKVVDIVVMMTHRGFFVLTKDDQRSTVV